MLSNEIGIIGGSSCEWSSCSFWMCSFTFKTPSEVRALTAAPPSSPAALASASALFVGLKKPYLRSTLGMFHSSFDIPFLNDSMFWRTLLTIVLPLILLRRMSLGRKDEQTFKWAPFFSVRASEIKSFTRVENGVLVSLGRDWSVPGNEKIFSGLSSLESSVSQSVVPTNSSSSG